MAQLDIGKTAFAGFSLIGRKPLAVVGWALFILVVGVLPVVGLLSAAGPGLVEFIETVKAGAEPNPDHMMSFIGPMTAANPILQVLGIAMRVIVSAAIFRAILEPDQGRWAYLRLGMGELMLLVVVIVMFIAYFVILAVFAALAFAIGIALWQASHEAAIAFGVLAGLVFLVGTIWLGLRFSLAAPMSFAEKNFRLIESWRLTRGHAGSLFLVALILFVVLIAIELIVSALLLGGIAAAGASLASHGGFDEAALEAFFSQPPSVWIQTIAPWAAIVAVVGSLIAAAVMAVITAPWAEAYRQLRPST